MTGRSPFIDAGARHIDPAKFRDPLRTAKGEPRASVSLVALETLWFNTGTLCNLACKTCYIESSPRNDALVYLSLDEVRAYLDEIARAGLSTREIGFTGGEPFMNRDCVAMLDLCLARGFEVLVLTNAMQPMRRCERALLALPQREKLTVRVSLDHYTPLMHEAERGAGTWNKAIDGLRWLTANGFRTAIAGRRLPHEELSTTRAGYAALFAQLALDLDCDDAAQLVLFPEMDASADVPEISTACWALLHVEPASVMCASSRMVVKRKGESTPRIAACTLLPYDSQFDMGASLADAKTTVWLNHAHCARFCVLGGASCSARGDP
jgi:uncharacterized Fe-S cluster-containing radical SAM superfamily protein